LFETENERQKTKPVPISLPRASRNFLNVKTRNEFFFYNWASQITPFICFAQLPGRLFSPSDVRKKMSHHFLLHFPIGMGSYDHHAKYQGLLPGLL
jgi:hypothetical protein